MDLTDFKKELTNALFKTGDVIVAFDRNKVFELNDYNEVFRLLEFKHTTGRQAYYEQQIHRNWYLLPENWILEYKKLSKVHGNVVKLTDLVGFITSKNCKNYDSLKTEKFKAQLQRPKDLEIKNMYNNSTKLENTEKQIFEKVCDNITKDTKIESDKIQSLANLLKSIDESGMKWTIILQFGN